MAEWSSYLYILEWVLVCQSAPQRQELVQRVGGLVINKAIRLFEHNKLLRVELTKVYLDFLVCLGHDICWLRNVDIVMVTDTLRKIFTSLEPDEHEYLFEPIVTLCNHVVSIPTAVSIHTADINPDVKYRVS